MTELLDIIDNSLQEVEEQLLQEFSRIRNSLSEARFEPIDAGIKNALGEVLLGLRSKLEHSGDKNNLQLQTEQHEVLFTRMSVIKQLLEAKIPTAYLQEIHQDVATSRKQLERKVIASRSHEESKRSDEPIKQSGFFKSIKSIFSADKSVQENQRNRIKITDREQQEFEDVEVYLDNGIYSASRELAMLSSLVFETAEVAEEPVTKKKPAAPAGPQGKAQFNSRDLSKRKAEALPDPVSTGQVAQTPEDIRRKLESRNASSSGASIFEARDIAHAMPTPEPKRQSLKTPKTDTGRGDIARTPEAIRQKLAERQQFSSGKASFASKDIESEVPQAFNKKPLKPKLPEPKPQEPTSKGKAVFESRDLSKPDPQKK
jgi:hypothetical protein